MSAVIQVFWGMAVLAPGMLLGIVILWLTPQRRPTPQPNANAPQECACSACSRGRHDLCRHGDCPTANAKSVVRDA